MARVRQGDHTVLPATHIRTIPAAFIPTPGRDISHSFVTEGTAHGLVKHSMYLNTNSCVTNLQLRFIHCQVARCRQQHSKTLRPRVARLHDTRPWMQGQHVIVYWNLSV